MGSLPEVNVERQDGTDERRAETARAPIGHRRCTMRVIRDQRQGIVLVYEIEPSATDTRPRSLVFESGEWRAQIDHYPADWRHLADEELLALRSE